VSCRGRPRGVDALGEACFEAPKVLEVLARPEQEERGVHRRFVAAARSGAHTGEQPSAGLFVPDVGRRHLASLDERGPQGGVPRLQGFDFAVEVAGAAVDLRARGGRTSECRERLGGAADACGAADERGDVLDAVCGGGALGEVLPKRIVEAVECSLGGTGGVVSASPARSPRRCDYVVRGA
jgi:hypothetical protein